MLGVDYGNEEVTEEIYKIKMEAELNASIDLAILRGTFPLWEREKEFSPYTENNWYKFVQGNYYELYKKMYKYGRRNSGLSTIAPTGSISILVGCTSGIEPLFMPYYTRRKKVVNEEVPNFIDENGVGYREYVVIHPMFKKWIKHYYNKEISFDTISNAELDLLFRKSPWYNNVANDIDYKVRLKTQAIAQKYISASISSTINLPNDISQEVVSNIYLEAHDLGIKGITVYRDGSRSGVLVSNDKKELKRLSPKRPKELKGVAHITKIKGITHTVIIGFLDNKPYEIFTFEGTTKEGEGIILKEGKRRYKFTSNDCIRHISNLMNDEQATITRLISMSLRHGVDIKFIVEQLKKNESTINSFISGIVRVLVKYIPKEELICPECGGKIIKEAGCEKCINCGASKCMLIKFKDYGRTIR